MSTEGMDQRSQRKAEAGTLFRIPEPRAGESAVPAPTGRPRVKRANRHQVAMRTVALDALLVRVGIDQTFVEWNAPVDPVSARFVYVPIPERRPGALREGPGCRRSYAELVPIVEAFAAKSSRMDTQRRLLPERLLGTWMHLDPDFECLTYGDTGRRARQIKRLHGGDLIVFHAGLRPVAPCPHRLLYSLIGLYVVESIVPAASIADRVLWPRNAHTRRTPGNDEVVVQARPGVSGRLDRCIPVGEWRRKAYRVREDILDAWGGITVKDGYLQRSAHLPRFCSPEKFLRWFESRGVSLLQRNN